LLQYQGWSLAGLPHRKLALFNRGRTPGKTTEHVDNATGAKCQLPSVGAVGHEDLDRGQRASTSYPLLKKEILCYATHTPLTLWRMHPKPTQQIIQLNAIVSGHLIGGTVTFSPAPEPGILSELAKFEAHRILTAVVEEEIAAGRL